MGEPLATGEWVRSGFELLPKLLDGEAVERLRSDLAELSASEGDASLLSAVRLLRLASVRRVVESGALLREVERICGDRGQLLKLEATFGSLVSDPPRSWHRDVSAPTTQPISVSAIVYLDEMSELSGPTYVLPNQGAARPGDLAAPSPSEVAVEAGAGDALLVAANAWHSGSSRRSPRAMRRCVVVQYGYWWIKPQFSVEELPSEIEEGARRLYGLEAPAGDLYISDA